MSRYPVRLLFAECEGLHTCEIGTAPGRFREGVSPHQVTAISNAVGKAVDDAVADLSAEVQRLRGELTEAEGAVREELGEHADSLRDLEKATERYIAAESSLAALRASHAEVVRVVREWQEARVEEEAEAVSDDMTEAGFARFASAANRLTAATAALAALDLGGAE